jgi:REP element-mobilizing transposase RayT
MVRSPTLRFGADYHLYHRGNDNQNVFIEKHDYAHFLTLYTRHILPVADTYAYCLLSNHVHLLVRILTPEEQRVKSRRSKRVLTPNRQFTNLFDAYGKAMNETYGRAGSLFQPTFSRVGVTSLLERDFLAVYIHQNPMRHGLVDDFRQWPHSSYHAPQSICPLRDELFATFRGRVGFERAHSHQWPVPPEQIARLAPDDFD